MNMTTTETTKNGTKAPVASKPRATRGTKPMTVILAAQATMTLRKRIVASGLDVAKVDALVTALQAAEGTV
jgi:hypothetical protein